MIDWENQQLEQHQLQQQHQQQRLHLQRARQQLQRIQSGSANGDEAAEGAVYVKVMTDDQLETLRKQIAVYRTICEQLVEAHKNFTSQQDLAGARLGSLYCDPFMTSTGHKISSSRQRWTPSPMQLQILESIFDQGNGTPSKQKIKDITAELSQHGQISETNVYNWFQNRRARSKRKQQNPLADNNPTESEAEAEVESAKDKKTKAQDPHSQSQQHSSVTTRPENPKICSDMHYLDPKIAEADSMISSDGVLIATILGQMPIFDGNEMLSNSRNDYLHGKMEASGNFNW